METLTADQERRAEGLREQFERAMADFKDRHLPAAEMRFIARYDGRRVKLHVARADGVHLLPHLWRTRCGRPFAAWTFTRHADAKDFPEDARCRKCMVLLRSQGRAVGHSGRAGPTFRDVGPSRQEGTHHAAGGRPGHT